MITNRRLRTSWTLVLVAILSLALATPVGLIAVTPAAAIEDRAEGLRSKLESASRGYLAAQAALEKSGQRQASLTQEITVLERQITALAAKTDQIVVGAYRSGPISTMSVLARSESREMFLDRIAVLNTISMHHNRQLEQYAQTMRQLSADRAAVAVEVAKQQRQLEEMARRKRDSELALASFGGGQTTAGFTGASSGAAPAPRRTDGGWAAESCSVDDPTTSGCITPRMLHALQQIRAAGYTRHTSCFRSGGYGEHPKGRACDFAAASSGFGGAATGGDRSYGDSLASYCVANTGALGVLYVIWYRQIWMPATGWRAYTNGNGDPASDHTNHVHLSVT